jgi:hypothetical protein
MTIRTWAQCLLSVQTEGLIESSICVLWGGSHDLEFGTGMAREQSAQRPAMPTQRSRYRVSLNGC